MYLYALTLQRATAITSAIVGNFSGSRQQEVLVARGKVLELLRPDEAHGKIVPVLSVDCFGVIRSIVPFRFTGSSKDYIMIGSDSGRIVILEYNPTKNSFEKIHQETYGKSGCRRIVPGQYLGVDSKGRAAMIGAVEKQKFVYVLNRDTSARLTISSPLEAHKSHNIVFDISGLDVGFDNPVFAAIELDYSEADQDSTGEAASEAQKHLTYYELDLGLNHVVRKWSEPVDNGANAIVPVPGGGDGPSGVLVLAENFVIYKHQGHPDVRAVIPRRTDLPADRGVLLVASAGFRQKAKFFFLVQSEYGDIYKVTMNVDDKKENVTELKIKYFDTIPTCTAMCVLKSGLLFTASEFGNHALYQFQGLGEDENDVESSSATLMETEEGFQPVFFQPRKLKNLILVDELESLSPVLDMKVTNLFDEETPQIFAVCGRGSRSTLRILRPGLAVQEMAVSQLPGNPNAVWTVKRSNKDDFDAYIVVSFVNATLVLSIGETIEEVSDSGFLGTTPSLSISLLGDDSLMQVYPTGIRHIRPDRRINEWKAPGKRTIQRVASNAWQVVIALTGGDLVYFELDVTGQLMEVEKKEMGVDVACLDMAPTPEGRQRTRFLAVGTYDSTLRVLSLDPDDTLSGLALQALPSPAESLLILDNTDSSGGIFLNAGLQNGVLLRTEVDGITGQLSDTRTRFLGTKPPKIVPCMVHGQRAMLCLSSRPWIGYTFQGRFTMTPLSYDTLEHAHSFSSDQVAEGIVAVAKDTVRIISVERLGEMFNQTSYKLRYTPRKFIVHPEHRTLIIIEGDHGSLTAAERQAGIQSANEASGINAASANGNGAMAVDGGEGGAEGKEEQEEGMADDQFGMPKAATGRWTSCIRVMDPRTGETTNLLELDGNELATSLCTVQFQNSQNDLGMLLAVGTVKDLGFYPRSSSGGFIHIYKFTDEGRGLELLHKTPVDGIPASLCQFQGKLLAGVGSILRIYDLGKKKLLRKCENKGFPNLITQLHAMGDRIYAGDAQEGFFYAKYRRSENQIYVFADEVVPRWLSGSLLMDYDTVAGADKFGNVYVARLPAELSEAIEDDPTGGRLKWEQGQLNGAPHKIEAAIEYHVGETICALQRAALQPGGNEVLLYGTILGALGVLMPFTSREDVDFFHHLEMHMRQENPPLAGRDHIGFRSAYFPVKDTIDGDFCEQYAALSHDQQKRIADELDRTPGEVLKKLEDIRNRIM
eukprot:jgi/Chlat1/3370/Chrsp23S08824